MKRIISLLLAICMMASLTIVASAEETTETFSYTTADAYYMVTETATDGVVTAQAVSKKSLSTSSGILTKDSPNKWVLFRIPVGANWAFTSMTFSGRVAALGTSTVKLVLSSKADYDKAVAANGSTITADFLQRPANATENVITGSLTRSSNGWGSIGDKTPGSLTDSTALDNAYDGQYLYLAVSAYGNSKTQLLRSGYALDITITGTQIHTVPDLAFTDANSSVAINGTTATVTTNAGTGTAKLIVASYIGNEMTDVIVRTLNAADAEKGNIPVDISALSSGTKTKAFLWADDMITPLADAAEKTFTMKQETFTGANTTNSSYSTFYSMAETAFLIPGLNQSVVPQGITYREETNQFYLSGYFKNASSSVICVIDGDTGEIVGEHFLKNTDGSVYAGHVGGIAVGANNLYISHGCYVYRISLATIDASGYMGDLWIEDNINISVGELSNSTNRGCSYVDCSNGYLWVGNYYAAGSSSYDKPIHEDYNALVRAYKLDPTQPNGFAAENKAKNTDLYDYVPEVMYFVNEEKIQGGTTTGDYLILSRSGGATTSKLYVYDRTAATSQAVMILDEDREIPVISLSPAKTVSTLPYSEEIVAVGDDAYVTFESGAEAYRNNDGAYPTDSVWKIDLSKLLPSD